MPSHSALSALFYLCPGRQEGTIIHTFHIRELRPEKLRNVLKLTQWPAILSPLLHNFLFLGLQGRSECGEGVKGGFLSSVPLQVSVKRMRPPHRAREDTGVQRGRTEAQTQGKCGIKVPTIWTMPGPDTLPSFLLLLSWIFFFFSFISFSPISPPPLKYDFRFLCGNMRARPSTWSPHPASSEPGDAWQMPRCRRLGVWCWQMSSRWSPKKGCLKTASVIFISRVGSLF